MSLLLALACASPGLSGFFVEVHGPVVDPDGTPIEGATVELDAGNDDVLGATTTDGQGMWSYVVYGSSLEGNRLDVYVSAPGYADGIATFELNLKSPEIDELQAGPGETWSGVERRLSAVVLAPQSERASVAGSLVSATSGAAATGVPLTLRWGWNAPDGGPVIDTTTSSGAGGFDFAVDTPGVYTVTTSETDEWTSARFPVLLTADGNSATAMVCPWLDPGELVAALSWGSAPMDLDLHVSAPLRGGSAGDDGNGQYHVWAGAPQHPEDPPAGADIEAQMLRTDADGVGPETVELLDAPGAGEIRLTVVNNDDLSDGDLYALGHSHAVLQVWNGSDRPRYYSVAPGQSAVAWHPVTIAAPEATVWVLEEYFDSIDPANGKDF